MIGTFAERLKELRINKRLRQEQVLVKKRVMCLIGIDRKFHQTFPHFVKKIAKTFDNFVSMGVLMESNGCRSWSHPLFEWCRNFTI